MLEGPEVCPRCGAEQPDVIETTECSVCGEAYSQEQGSEERPSPEPDAGGGKRG